MKIAGVPRLALAEVRLPRNGRATNQVGGTVITICRWLDALGWDRSVCPFWPPDVYAIAGTLLRRSGAYLRVFEDDDRSRYRNEVRTLGRRWRDKIDALRRPTRSSLRSAQPGEIKADWSRLIRAGSTRISEIRESATLTESLIRMTLVSDETSVGIGVGWDNEKAGVSAPSTFLSLADEFVHRNRLRSFGLDISADVICVLGKQHTPQRGATFRSLSHHLALYLSNDIEARWVGPLREPTDPPEGREMLNLLLLPWPTRVESEAFSEVQDSTGSPTGYFRFHPKKALSPAQFRRALESALDRAQQHAERIDAVVFPELALTDAQYDVAERVAFRRSAILICGVRKRAARRACRDMNLCVLQPAGALRDPKVRAGSERRLLDRLRLVQAKHHRWCIDRSQVVSYQLAGQLPAVESRSCWESIELPPRILHFATLNRMTWSVLVCEDLARQDPAADLIRTVGPNLLVALLMDGPQMRGRWPSRYASVLADDPGTSVLTLTNLGMAERCRPILPTGQRAGPSRIVGLWRDAVAGEHEIALDGDDDACVLSLECRLREELSADGRGDGTATRYPVFAGFRSFRSAA